MPGLQQGLSHRLWRYALSLPTLPAVARRCLQLRYASQYEPPGLGGVDQADKIRKRLGDTDGSAFEQDEFPPKPRGMHWTTYRRLEERYDELQFRWTRAAMARFGFTGF